MRPEGRVVAKRRFPPFIQGALGPHEVLQGMGAGSPAVAGTAAGRRSESTARDAMVPDHKAVMAGDGDAARHDEGHLAGLASLDRASATRGPRTRRPRWSADRAREGGPAAAGGGAWGRVAA